MASTSASVSSFSCSASMNSLACSSMANASSSQLFECPDQSSSAQCSTSAQSASICSSSFLGGTNLNPLYFSHSAASTDSAASPLLPAAPVSSPAVRPAISPAGRSLSAGAPGANISTDGKLITIGDKKYKIVRIDEAGNRTKIESDDPAMGARISDINSLFVDALRFGASKIEHPSDIFRYEFTVDYQDGAVPKVSQVVMNEPRASSPGVTLFNQENLVTYPGVIDQNQQHIENRYRCDHVSVIFSSMILLEKELCLTFPISPALAGSRGHFPNNPSPASTPLDAAAASSRAASSEADAGFERTRFRLRSAPAPESLGSASMPVMAHESDEDEPDVNLLHEVEKLRKREKLFLCNQILNNPRQEISIDEINEAVGPIIQSPSPEQRELIEKNLKIIHLCRSLDEAGFFDEDEALDQDAYFQCCRNMRLSDEDGIHLFRDVINCALDLHYINREEHEALCAMNLNINDEEVSGYESGYDSDEDGQEEQRANSPASESAQSASLSMAERLGLALSATNFSSSQDNEDEDDDYYVGGQNGTPRAPENEEEVSDDDESVGYATPVQQNETRAAASVTRPASPDQPNVLVVDDEVFNQQEATSSAASSAAAGSAT